MEQRFIELVGQGIPRAMVLLAVAFALYVRVKKIWWIGECGMREARGIIGILGNEWGDVKKEIEELVREGEIDVYNLL